MTQQSSVSSESDRVIGIFLFGLGVALLVTVLAPSSTGGFSFLFGLVAGLLLAGGLDLIIHRTR